MSIFTLESVFGTDEEVIPEAPESKDEPRVPLTDNTIELLEIFRQRDKDPTDLFPRGEEGFFGRKDVFSIEQERLMSPELREFVSKYYGPGEMQIPLDPDAGWIERKWVEFLGRPLTKDEIVQIKKAQQIRARGSETPQDVMSRMWKEHQGFIPSPIETIGDLPEGFDDPSSSNYIPPYLREMAGVKHRVELPETQAFVLERDWLLNQPTERDVNFLARTKQASTDINELESLSPGLAATTIGPMLAEDYNREYRTDGPFDVRDLITAEDLDLKGTLFQGKNQLTFYHPDRKKRVALNAAAIELSDFAGVLPEIMVIGHDVVGSVLGALGGGSVAGPKGAAVGMWLGGALGAYAGRIKALKKSLDNTGFIHSEKYDGWVNDEVVDEEGQPKVITFNDLQWRAKDDALLSFGGGVLASTLFKIGRGILSRGARGLRGEVSEESFLRAVDNWNKQLGGPTNAKVNLSTVLENEADNLYKQSMERRTGSWTAAEGENLLREAAILREQAKLLRQQESMIPAAAVQEQVALQTLRLRAIAVGGTTAERVSGEDAADLGRQVARGWTEGTILKLRKEANDLIDQNNAAMAAFTRQTDTIVGAPETVGRSFWEKAGAVMGTPDGETGIYGAYNVIRRNMRTTSAEFRGRPIIPFDISEIARLVNKLHGRTTAGTAWAPGMRGGLPKEFMDDHNKALSLQIRTGMDKEVFERGDVPIMVRYDVIDDNIKAIRTMMTDPDLSVTQRQNLNQVQDEYVKIRDATLGDLDEQFGTNNLKLVQTTDEHFSRLSEIWQKNLFEGMEVGKLDAKGRKFTFAQWSDQLFGKGADQESVAKILRDLKPGKNQTELLRQLVLYRYKTHMRGVSRAAGDKEVNVTFPDETSIRMGLEDRGVTVTPANVVRHERFFDDNSAWIESLFKEGEWKKLTDTVTTSATLKREAKQLDTFNQVIRDSPLGGTGLFRLSDKNPAQIVIDDPQKLLDAIFEGKAGTPERGMRSLMKAIEGLPKLEQALANRRIRALTMRKLFNPLDNAPIASGERLMSPEAYAGIGGMVQELNKNKPTYTAIFGGKKHVEDLLKIFRQIHLLGRRGVSPEELDKDLTAAIAMGGLRWYVGVLNAKTRALTATQKVLGIDIQQRVKESLLDPNKAASIVQLGKVNLRTKLGANLLGQILGLNARDTQFAIDAFGTLSPYRVWLEDVQ